MGFEVERFEWAADNRIELVGRWFGLRGHRFLRPTLDVDVAGERRRMLADLEHKPWAPEEGEPWIAAFSWRGEPVHFENAELTVAPDLAIELPQPDNDLTETEVAESGDRLAAGPPRTRVLETELQAALVEVQRLSDELARVKQAHDAAVDDLRERLEGEKTRARELETAVAEAGTRAGLELAEVRSELQAAEAARDSLQQRLEAAEAERAVLTEQRDKARQERNAWMSRAHAAATQPPVSETREQEGTNSPEPPEVEAPRVEKPAVVEKPPVVPDARADRPAPSRERRTIQIGERPGPMPQRAPIGVSGPIGPGRNGLGTGFLTVWGPRVAALAVILVLLAVIALLLSLAF